MKNNYENLNELLNNAIKKLTEVSDVNMIVGSPYKLGDKNVLPVCRITLGFISGGGEYGSEEIVKSYSDNPVLGASGGVVNICPSGFLVEAENGFTFVDCPNNAVEKVINLCDNLLKGEK